MTVEAASAETIRARQRYGATAASVVLPSASLELASIQELDASCPSASRWTGWTLFRPCPPFPCLDPALGTATSSNTSPTQIASAAYLYRPLFRHPSSLLLTTLAITKARTHPLVRRGSTHRGFNNNNNNKVGNQRDQRRPVPCPRHWPAFGGTTTFRSASPRPGHSSSALDQQFNIANPHVGPRPNPSGTRCDSRRSDILPGRPPFPPAPEPADSL